MTHNNINKTISDALWGFAIGDAIGVPYEFMTKDLIAKNPCKGFSSGGVNGQKKGMFSDDTMMTLATIEGMTTNINRWQESVAKEIVLFATTDKYGKCFDIGNTTVNSVIQLQQGIHPSMTGSKDSLGNGSLVRMLPLALFFAFVHQEDYKEIISDISKITHANDECIQVCMEYCDIIKKLIVSGVKEIPSNTIDLNLPNGIARNALDQALYFFSSANSFKEAVLSTVNNGDDADSVAAIVGSFAGIYYEVPVSWKMQLRNKNKIINGIKTLQNVIYRAM